MPWTKKNKYFSNNNKSAFTLIEIIVVIVIIVILAAAGTATFYSLRAQAKESKVDSTVAALKEAVRHQHLQNMVNGQDVWPAENPLTLLSPPLPMREWFSGGQNPDGIHWRYYHYPSLNEWWIYCPYYDGEYNRGWQYIQSEGRFYIYYYGNNNPGPRNNVPGGWLIFAQKTYK